MNINIALAEESGDYGVVSTMDRLLCTRVEGDPFPSIPSGDITARLIDRWRGLESRLTAAVGRASSDFPVAW